MLGRAWSSSKTGVGAFTVKVKTSSFSLADLQSYLLTKLAERVCLLSHVLMRVRQQREVIGEVKVLQRIKKYPSDPSWLVFCCALHHPVYYQVKKDCRRDTSLTYACLDLQVQPAASHAAGDVVAETLNDLDDAQGNPAGSQKHTGIGMKITVLLFTYFGVMVSSWA